MYEFLGITLVLALLLTINATATLVAVGLGRVSKRLLVRCSARTRAEILFVMRIGPPVIAIVAIAAFMIPSYLTYEPHASGEVVGWKLGALAMLSAVGVGLAISRGLRSWLATRSLLKGWLASSTPVHLDEITVPTFVLRHTFPIIAVVGAVRPRLFIADQVFTSLSQEELAAAIAHEYGHLAAHDNFKRSVMRISRAALLLIPCGRSLDRAWSDASESAADEHAAQRSSMVALNLASALVRIAKMIPKGQQQIMPASVSAFLAGNEDTPRVRVRVKRLVELAASDPQQLVSSAPLVRFMPWVVLTFLVVTSITVESRPQVLAAVHAFVEEVVRFLS
ncbi:MAG TPA: M56 family metallopeptidase [Pyrinomonadaceae bacterium]|jgi:Zn-dependent protease with chaperone function|nr:M56 family metallopeptidase [Pyrinomonadaceae bacterium]